MDPTTVYILLAAVLGLFMALGIGANDVANAMGTSVGSRALTIRQAIVIAAVFELLGSVVAGGQVTNTIRKGIIDAELLAGSPELLICGMLAALLAAGIWLVVASWAGWPVSTTHSIVGAIVGFAAVGLGLSSVHWDKVGSIVMSWVVSPVMAGGIAFLLFRSVQRLILDAEKPFECAKKYVPIYMFLVGFIVALVTLLKGLKHIGLEFSTAQSYGLAMLSGAFLTGIGALAVRTVRRDPVADRDFHFASVERVFGILMMVTACAMAFAHGSNDVANAIGPVAAVVAVAQSGGNVAATAAVPLWILAIGGIGIVLGLVFYGYRVMATVGTRITDLTPSRGFAATLAAATTVVLASGTGLPISTTHTLVGAVLGVGIARGMAAIDMSVVRMIFMSWIITLPAGALLAVIFFYMFRMILL
ncbi:MAG TPA: inorganic phosphate transporter [Arenicellales bacterium]|nr:inorganic phosphate transporter [Arenicellales bacterium]